MGGCSRDVGCEHCRVSADELMRHARCGPRVVTHAMHSQLGRNFKPLVARSRQQHRTREHRYGLQGAQEGLPVGDGAGNAAAAGLLVLRLPLLW